MRWLDVSGVRSRILATVSRRDAFLHRLIDAERRRMDEGGAGDEGEKKSMIAVLLTLQKTEPELYTDQMIIALCARRRRAPPQLPPVHHQRDATPVPGGTAAAAARVLRRLQGRRLRRAERHHADRERVHPAVWEDPTAFRPERFEDGKGDGLLMMPFGMGRRRCPGEALALQTVGVVLGTLVQCFDWDRVDGVEVDMTEGVGITMPKAVALEAVCRPRAAMRDVLQKL
ncbi:hypothetical protein CFC21_017165 [Triticum aestivum]|uniref:Cytochrome P450 n=2 Tax=Triticum aestivum TaxID=4565 RepID=A0A3B6AY14_WHEAT|nr:hypothetical protein CFC21_017165 [Triticum aestivum]